MSEEKELEVLRQRIDQLDREIQDLINKRVKVAKQIADVKSHSGSECFYRPEREARILRAIVGRNQGPVSNDDMARLFREIMSVSLAAQASITVAFLGPEGTYTHNATLKHFGHSVKCLSLPTIDEVFHAVDKRQAHYGIVPVENSTEGVVTHTLDMFFDSSLKICGEVLLRVRHQLLSNAESLSQVDKVLAHSQSLAQCRRWLANNLPWVETAATSSNAEAAEQAAQRPNLAAIASTAAAEIYGVKVLVADIEDDPDNTTRFLIIGNTEVEPSGDDKTSLLVSSQNKPGALYRLLAPLAKHGVSMTRIESRPSRKGLWEYVFFIDIEGHAKERRIAEVLAELEKEAALMKLLGAYPRAVL